MLRAGWQLLFHDGCRVAVPASWRADPDAGFVLGPVGDNLSVQRFTITNWSAHKAQVRAAFGRVNVVHEDSDRRLWLEIGDKHSTQHYIDVPLLKHLHGPAGDSCRDGAECRRYDHNR